MNSSWSLVHKDDYCGEWKLNYEDRVKLELKIKKDAAQYMTK